MTPDEQQHQPTLFDAPARLSAHKQGNPMLAVYGIGPEGTRCESCDHFQRMKYHDGTYMKCDLRTLTHGAGSDHRAKYPAWGKFEKRTT